jgi:predicted amidohydrolase
MGSITVAAICMECRTGEVERNLAEMERLTARAASAGASLVCFPELSATGYLRRGADVKTAAGLSEAISSRLLGMATAYGCTVLAGLVEPGDNGGIYVSHMVVSPEGVAGRHRKTHLPPPESGLYRAGSRLDLFHRGPVSYGIQLCYESHFPELSTLMALEGAQILFFPHASPRGSPEGKLKSWLRHLPARAFDNAVFVIACNQSGLPVEGCHFPGVALALDPQGYVLASHTGSSEHVMVVTLNLEILHEARSHRMKYFIPRRRPSMYRALTGRPRTDAC